MVSPATLDGGRALAVLQLVSTAALPSALNSRLAGGPVTWSPALDATSDRLFIPAQAIEAPDTVRAGVPFAIVANTIGENGCWQADGGSLVQRGDSVLISAYDRHSGAPVCTMLWTDRLQHHFTASFPSPGLGVIRSYGRRAYELGKIASIPVVAQRSVVVLP